MMNRTEKFFQFEKKHYNELGNGTNFYSGDHILEFVLFFNLLIRSISPFVVVSFLHSL